MITVLGATGNVGSKLVHQLLARGQPIRAIARHSGGLHSLIAGKGEFRAGDISNTEFLTQALTGSEAAFVMIPPDYAAHSLLDHYRKMSKSIASAVRGAGVPKVVSLSSLGAEHPSGTGPIKGLHEHEQILNTLDADVLHLRATYFMENLLMNVPLIQSQAIMGSAIRGDMPIPMIATRDIAKTAADRLVVQDFKGKTVHYLLGQRDLTLREAARIVSRILAVEIPYVEFDVISARRGLIQMGLSPDAAEQFLEMADAFNQGLITGKGLRNPSNTTPTSFEEFAEIFKLALAGVGSAA